MADRRPLRPALRAEFPTASENPARAIRRARIEGGGPIGYLWPFMQPSR